MTRAYISPSTADNAGRYIEIALVNNVSALSESPSGFYHMLNLNAGCPVNDAFFILSQRLIRNESLLAYAFSKHEKTLSTRQPMNQPSLIKHRMDELIRNNQW